MADRLEGRVSTTPIVTIAADDDADSVDAIHHDIKGAVGGALSFTAADGDDNFFYAPNVIVTSSTNELFGASADDLTDLVGASGDQVNGPNEGVGAAVTYTDGSTADCGSDRLWYLYIENTGTSDIVNTTTTNSVYLTLNGGTTVYDNDDAIEIPANQAVLLRPNGPVLSNITVSSGQTRRGGTASTVNGSTSVRCKVVAMIEDIA